MQPTCLHQANMPVQRICLQHTAGHYSAKELIKGGNLQLRCLAGVMPKCAIATATTTRYSTPTWMRGTAPVGALDRILMASCLQRQAYMCMCF